MTVVKFVYQHLCSPLSNIMTRLTQHINIMWMAIHN